MHPQISGDAFQPVDKLDRLFLLALQDWMGLAENSL